VQTSIIVNGISHVQLMCPNCKAFNIFMFRYGADQYPVQCTKCDKVFKLIELIGENAEVVATLD
jgi:predicted Zn finger-like uncharacterized protein